MSAWIPTQKQEEALASPAQEILYGGSRGGGKSEAAIAFCAKYVNYPKAVGLVLRKNAKDLEDFIARFYAFYQSAGVVKSGNPAKFVFPSGAVVHTGHLGTADAYQAFQGWEIQFLIIEELTHIPNEDLYEKMIGSVRTNDPAIPARIFLTTNPGSQGHLWVKKRFKIGEVPPGTIFKHKGKTKIFVQSKITDNPHLMKADPAYYEWLNGLSGTLKKQWLEGEWNDYTIKGAYYIEQMKVADEENRVTSVPYTAGLPTWSFWDIGVRDKTVIISIQRTPAGIYNVVDTYAKSGGNLQEFANHLINLSNARGFRYLSHFLPHDAAVRSVETGQRRDVAIRKAGLTAVRVLKRTSDVLQDIDVTRGIIQKCFFDISRDNYDEGGECHNQRLVDALFTYHAKFNETTQQYSQKPEHTWESDYADAFRTFGVAEQQKYLKGTTYENGAQPHVNE